MDRIGARVLHIRPFVASRKRDAKILYSSFKTFSYVFLSFQFHPAPRSHYMRKMHGMDEVVMLLLEQESVDQ